MRRASIFGEAFLDGFTMAGFLDRLDRPGAPTSLLEPSEAWAPNWQEFINVALSDEAAASEDGLSDIPEETLNRAILVLHREIEGRKLTRTAPPETAHGPAR